MPNSDLARKAHASCPYHDQNHEGQFCEAPDGPHLAACDTHHCDIDDLDTALAASQGGHAQGCFCHPEHLVKYRVESRRGTLSVHEYGCDGCEGYKDPRCFPPVQESATFTECEQPAKMNTAPLPLSAREKVREALGKLSSYRDGKERGEHFFHEDLVAAESLLESALAEPEQGMPSEEELAHFLEKVYKQYDSPSINGWGFVSKVILANFTGYRGKG